MGYIFDMSACGKSKTKDEVNVYTDILNNHISLLSTISQEKILFSKEKVKLAIKARYLQQCMGLPSDESLKYVLKYDCKLLNNLE